MEIRLTRAALERLQALRAEHGLGPGFGLRLSVHPAASGPERFALDLDEGPGPRDRSWPVQGMVVFCDPKTYLYLTDLEIDWRGDSAGFWIRHRSRGNNG